MIFGPLSALAKDHLMAMTSSARHPRGEARKNGRWRRGGSPQAPTQVIKSSHRLDRGGAPRGDGSLLPRQQLRKYECDGRGEKHKNHGCNESTRDELLAGRHRMVGIFRGHVAF